MSLYISLNENGIPDQDTKRTRPRWLNSDGSPVTDTFLRDTEGLYPLVSNRPDYDQGYEYVTLNTPDQWVVHNDYVEMTYTVNHHDIDHIFIYIQNQLLPQERYLYETSGFIFTDSDGRSYELHSSRDAQSALAAERLAITNGVRSDNEKWKTLGGFTTFTNQQIIEAYDALRTFVKQCFERESEIIEFLYQPGLDHDELRRIRDVEVASGWPAAALYPDLNTGG